MFTPVANSTSDKICVPMCYTNFGTTSSYLYLANTADPTIGQGYPLTRAGSVTGLAVHANVTIATTPGVVTFSPHINGSALYTYTPGSPITTTGWYDVLDTQAEGAYTFSAGDRLALYITFSSFVGYLAYVLATVEVTLS